MEILIFILLVLVLAVLLWVYLQLRRVQNELAKHTERLNTLEAGMVPDHEKAKAAAKATNDFMAGIASIMGYDPFEARKRANGEEGGSLE